MAFPSINQLNLHQTSTAAQEDDDVPLPTCETGMTIEAVLKGRLGWLVMVENYTHNMYTRQVDCYMLW